MFKIFAQNINPYPDFSGSGEQLLFSIPTESISDIPFLNLTVNDELGNAGSCEFTVDAESKLTDIWRQMRTLVRIEYDDKTIFFGRVLTIDRDMFRSKKIHCEGAFTFLMDSVFESAEKGFNIPLGTYITNLLNAHNACMAECPEKRIYPGELPGSYSSGISDEQKIPNETHTYATGHGYKAVKEYLEELSGDFGGFFRVRYELENFNDTIGQYGQGNIDLNNRIVVHNEDGSISTEKSFSTNIDGKEVLLPTIINGEIVSEEAAIAYYNQNGKYLGKFNTVSEADTYAQQLHERQDWYYHGKPKIGKLYLDWMRNYFNKGAIDQVMSVSSNTVDLSDTMEVDNIFTHVIAVGDGWTYSNGSSGGSGTATNGNHKITISVNHSSLGTAYASLTEAKEGQVVTLKATPSEDKTLHPTFSRWYLTSGGVIISALNSPVASFTMGNQDVTIEAQFNSDAGIYPGTEHSITVRPDSAFSGTVGANFKASAPGRIIYLYNKPKKGHKFKNWTGNVNIVGNSFTMPDYNVSVVGHFEIVYNGEEQQ